MEKILLISLAVCVLLFGQPTLAEAATTEQRTVSDVVEHSKVLDGTSVRMTVEMIGDIMYRGNYAWINGLDDTGAIGLWMPESLAQNIKVLGNWKHKGDVVVIRGVLNRSCNQHGGDMDVHVTDSDTIAPGYAFDRTLPNPKILAAFWLSLSGAAVVAVYVLARHR